VPGPECGERDAASAQPRRRGNEDRAEQTEQKRRRAGADVRLVVRVVPDEGVARRRELEADDRDEEHPDRDVPREETSERKQRQPLGGQQDEEDRGGDRRQPRIAFGRRIVH